MSTIEEAREQAREALAQWDAPGGNHSGQVIGFLASALRALLDATEPPKPAEDEREALAEMDEFLDGIFTPSGRELLMTVMAAAGYSKGPRPITDQMVLAGLNAEQPRAATGDLSNWHPDSQARMRAALEAAEEARR